MPVRTAFSVKTNTNITNEWKLLEHMEHAVSREVLADAVAQHIMHHLFYPTPEIIEAWNAKRLDFAPHADPDVAAQLADILERRVKLPETPGVGTPDEVTDHLEGLVSEHLWHLLTLHEVHCDPHVYLMPPGHRVTDQGADGLVIHRSADGNFEFRLWEVKKNAGGTALSTTVRNAYQQLETQGSDYLQELAKVGEHQPDAALRAFFSRLVWHWRRGEPQAAAGIAVTAERGPQRGDPFSALGTSALTSFASPNRLRGLITAVGDVRAFSLLVRGVLWSGL